MPVNEIHLAFSSLPYLYQFPIVHCFSFLFLQLFSTPISLSSSLLIQSITLQILSRQSGRFWCCNLRCRSHPAILQLTFWFHSFGVNHSRFRQNGVSSQEYTGRNLLTSFPALSRPQPRVREMCPDSVKNDYNSRVSHCYNRSSLTHLQNGS